MTMMQEIIKTVANLVENDPLYFESAVEVKPTPHTLTFTAWAVCVSPSGELYVMDSEEAWHHIEETDTLIIQSLYGRIKWIAREYAAA